MVSETFLEALCNDLQAVVVSARYQGILLNNTSVTGNDIFSRSRTVYLYDISIVLCTANMSFLLEAAV